MSDSTGCALLAGLALALSIAGFACGAPVLGFTALAGCVFFLGMAVYNRSRETREISDQRYGPVPTTSEPASPKPPPGYGTPADLGLEPHDEPSPYGPPPKDEPNKWENDDRYGRPDHGTSAGPC